MHQSGPEFAFWNDALVRMQERITDSAKMKAWAMLGYLPPSTFPMSRYSSTLPNGSVTGG
jgi:hypothetical protein